MFRILLQPHNEGNRKLACGKILIFHSKGTGEFVYKSIENILRPLGAIKVNVRFGVDMGDYFEEVINKSESTARRSG